MFLLLLYYIHPHRIDTATTPLSSGHPLHNRLFQRLSPHGGRICIYHFPLLRRRATLVLLDGVPGLYTSCLGIDRFLQERNLQNVPLLLGKLYTRGHNRVEEELPSARRLVCW